MSEKNASQAGDKVTFGLGQVLQDGLGQKHASVLTDMAKKRGMTDFQVLRQALALYQMVENRADIGEKMAFIKDGKVVVDDVPGLGDIGDEPQMVQESGEDGLAAMFEGEPKPDELAVARALFEQSLFQVNEALKADDMSLAQFPRTGDVARVELLSRRDNLVWVLEMLPAPATEEDMRHGHALKMRDAEMNRLIDELMEANSMARRDYLFDQILHVWNAVSVVAKKGGTV